jgi:glycosyltransferase involved in cell wall biosynthesis
MEKTGKKRQVSVIIPTFNRAAMLKEAVDSVLAQDFRDFELIVVDDGSTDHTLEILNAYQEDITLLHQRNQGVSRARNAGIKAASGSLVAFLDSDDLWLPQKLARQVDFFNANPEAQICQTEEIWLRNNVRVNPKKRHKKPSGMIFEPSLNLCLVSPSAAMIRQSLFDKVGLFDESLPACEDYDLWLRISCRYPVYLIETPLIIKRGGHADQLSRLPRLDKFRIQAITKIMASNLLSSAQYRAAVKVLKEKCAIYAAGCRKRGRLDEAAQYETLAKNYLL